MSEQTSIHAARRGSAMLRNAWGRVRRVGAAAVGDERGDVPGWVLITLMTAGLVFLIWSLAGPALSDLFTQAINRVSGL